MLYPSINEIKKKADSRYTLVILAAKRARDIVDGKPPLVVTDIKRPVSIAAKEINEDMITVKQGEEPAPEVSEEEELAEGAKAETEEAATEAETDTEDAEEKPLEEAADDAEELESIEETE